MESTRVHSTVDRLDADGIGILAPESTNPPILCAAKNTPVQGMPQMPEMPLTPQGTREAGRAHGPPARRHSRAATGKHLVNWKAELMARQFYRAMHLAPYYGQWLSLFLRQTQPESRGQCPRRLFEANSCPQIVDICASCGSATDGPLNLRLDPCQGTSLLDKMSRRSQSAFLRAPRQRTYANCTAGHNGNVRGPSCQHGASRRPNSDFHRPRCRD